MTDDRHETAAQRGLDPLAAPVADVTGTSVPHSDQAIHDHWDEAYALGYLRGYADGRDDGVLVGLDKARRAVEALEYADPYPALAAIDALRGES